MHPRDSNQLQLFPSFLYVILLSSQKGSHRSAQSLKSYFVLKSLRILSRVTVFSLNVL